MNRWEAEKKVVLKALKDPAFKQRLLANPKEACKEALKGDFNLTEAQLQKLQIKVVQEKQGEWVIGLPQTTTESKELTDEEIKNLMAGSSPYGQTAGTDGYGCSSSG